MQDRWLLLQIFALQIEGNRSHDGGLALAFSLQAGVLHMALSTAKSTEKLQETRCPFGVPVIQSDPVFWSGSQDSSLSLRSLRQNEAKETAERTKTPHPSIHAEFDQFSAVI